MTQRNLWMLLAVTVSTSSLFAGGSIPVGAITSTNPCCSVSSVSGCGTSCGNSCSANCSATCSASCSTSCNQSCSTCSGDSCDNCSFSDNNCNSCVGTSRSVFTPRSLTTDQTLELALNNYFIYHNAACPEDRGFLTTQLSYFHLQSQKGLNLARYFLPGRNTQITVAENGTGNIGSLYVELIAAALPASFSSNVTICPERKVDGGYFDFRFDTHRWLSGTWFAISFAAARAEHNINIRETDITNPGTLVDNGYAVTNAIQAFNNPAWTAGKIAPCSLVKSGVDDIQFKLGWNYFFCNQDHLGLYLVGTAPTGNNTKAQYLFEPIVGSRHGSFGVGLNADWTWYECGNHSLNWMADLKYRYVFKACERRSFDLCANGDWSRYFPVVTAAQPSFSMPGINFFTQFVDVTPRSTVDFWTALHYEWCHWNFEAGYDFWWRDAETVCPKCDLANIGIYDLVGQCQQPPTSSSTANISESIVGPNQAPRDATFVTLTNADLNFASGANPRAHTNKVYGAVSYNGELWCLPTMIGFGGEYEFAGCQAAFEQWGVFLKTGMSF